MKQTNFIFYLFLFCILYLQMYDGGYLLKGQGLDNAKCGTNDLHQELLITDPNYHFGNEFYEETYQFYMMNGNANNASIQRMAPYAIPTVIHIVSPASGNLLLNAEIEGGITWINNILAGGIPCGNQEAGLDVEIQLCLAQRTINNGVSSGITNDVSDELTNHDISLEQVALKALGDVTNYPSTDYLNIWVVESINNTALGIDQNNGEDIAGYAKLAAAHGTLLDGIVVEAATWADCDAIKLVVHEIGHYFNLRHTFLGGCENVNCLEQGDFVCDTPPDNTSGSNDCNLTDSCPADNEFDLHNNYMDYGLLSCHTSFTDDQKERMLYTLEGSMIQNPNGLRSSLLSSEGCFLPCDNPIDVSFSAPLAPINLGTTFDFFNTSIPSNNIAYDTFEWFVNNEFQEQNNNVFSYDFWEEGIFTITLTASGSDINCTPQSYNIIVEVVCPVSADFEVLENTLDVLAGTTLTFTTDLNPSDYDEMNWYIGSTTELPELQNENTFEYTFNSSEFVYLEICTTVDGIVCCDVQSKFISTEGYCKNNNVWCLGRYAGLDFNAGEPVPIENVATINSETWATMADDNGNLLLYVGQFQSTIESGMPLKERRIYDREHNVIVGGQGLKGGDSPLQGSLIIKHPNPELENIYYVFINGGDEVIQNGNPETIDIGLHYSLVDMTGGNISSMDGQALGAVLSDSKNSIVNTTATEALTAVAHCNERDIWLISTKDNLSDATNPSLEVYAIDEMGITGEDGNPNTAITPVHSYSIPSNNKIYCIKVSTQRNKIAFHTKEEVFLGDFNKITGEITNINSIMIATEEEDLYGLEFSPNNNFLYLTIRNFNNFDSDIIQIDLNSFQEQQIVSLPLDNNNLTNFLGYIQLASNGRIYIGNNNNSYLPIDLLLYKTIDYQ
ncbi:MAG: M43 family zinc metalloprotease [Chitinophagales bacterium]